MPTRETQQAPDGLVLKALTKRYYTRCPSIGRVPNFQQQSLVARMGPSYIHVSAVHPRCHFRNNINNYNLRSQRFPCQRPSDVSVSFWRFFSHLLSVLTSSAHLESSAVPSSSLGAIITVHVVTSSAFLIQHDTIDPTSSLLLESTFVQCDTARNSSSPCRSPTSSVCLGTWH